MDPKDGAIYVTGWVDEGYQYDWPTGFLHKYDAQGTLVWAIEYPSESYLSDDAWIFFPNGVIIDRVDGNVIVTGEGAPVARYVSPVVDPSGMDLVFLKYRPDGTLLWMRAWDITRREAPYVIRQLANGDFIVGLWTEAPFRSDDEARNLTHVLLNVDAGLAYITREGVMKWAHVWGRDRLHDKVDSLVVDDVNDVVFVNVGYIDLFGEWPWPFLTDMYVFSVHEGTLLGNWTLLPESLGDKFEVQQLEDLYLDAETQRLLGVGAANLTGSDGTSRNDVDFFLVEYQLHPERYPPHEVDAYTSLEWWYLTAERDGSADAQPGLLKDPVVLVGIVVTVVMIPPAVAVVIVRQRWKK